MADIAGAKRAIRDRLVANWTTTPITYQNEFPAGEWPPADRELRPLPWINLEIEVLDSRIVGQGRPGNHVYRYDGLISVHVFTPFGIGIETGDAFAAAIGEIFRRKKFYEVAAGVCVRTQDPYPAEGNGKSDDGQWFGTTMTCAFVYWHRG